MKVAEASGLGGQERRVAGQRLAAAQHSHAPQLAHALAAEEALLVGQHGVREVVPRRAAATSARTSNTFSQTRSVLFALLSIKKYGTFVMYGPCEYFKVESAISKIQ